MKAIANSSTVDQKGHTSVRVLLGRAEAVIQKLRQLLDGISLPEYSKASPGEAGKMRSTYEQCSGEAREILRELTSAERSVTSQLEKAEFSVHVLEKRISDIKGKAVRHTVQEQLMKVQEEACTLRRLQSSLRETLGYLSKLLRLSERAQEEAKDRKIVGSELVTGPFPGTTEHFTHPRKGR